VSCSADQIVGFWQGARSNTARDQKAGVAEQ